MDQFTLLEDRLLDVCPNFWNTDIDDAALYINEV